MCIYRLENKCKVSQEICPWVYWCDKVNGWKELSKMPKVCKVAEKQETPNGYNKVLFEKHGNLYIDVNSSVVKIKNPYDYIPKFVRVYKTKDEWKIKKEKINEGH